MVLALRTQNIAVDKRIQYKLIRIITLQDDMPDTFDIVGETLGICTEQKCLSVGHCYMVAYTFAISVRYAQRHHNKSADLVSFEIVDPMALRVLVADGLRGKTL